MSNEEQTLDMAIVDKLQIMVVEGVLPSHMLEFLQTKVDNEQIFAAYMKAACPYNDCDEGMIWLVASRWWTGNQTPAGANRLLMPIFSEARKRWARDKGSRDD